MKGTGSISSASSYTSSSSLPGTDFCQKRRNSSGSSDFSSVHSDLAIPPLKLSYQDLFVLDVLDTCASVILPSYTSRLEELIPAEIFQNDTWRKTLLLKCIGRRLLKCKRFKESSKSNQVQLAQAAADKTPTILPREQDSGVDHFKLKNYSSAHTVDSPNGVCVTSISDHLKHNTHNLTMVCAPNVEGGGNGNPQLDQIHNSSKAQRQQANGPSVLVRFLLRSDLQDGISSQIENLTPFQENCMQAFLNRKDLIVVSGHGTGKTILAQIEVLQSIDLTNHSLQAIFVVATPEAALKAVENIKKLGSGLKAEIPLCLLAEFAVSIAEKTGAQLALGHIIVGTVAQIHKIVMSNLWKFKNRDIKCLVLDGFENMSESNLTYQVYQFGTTGDTHVTVLARNLNSAQMEFAELLTPKNRELSFASIADLCHPSQFYIEKVECPYDNISLLIRVLELALYGNFQLTNVVCKASKAPHIFQRLLEAGILCELYGLEYLRTKTRIFVVPEHEANFVLPKEGRTLLINFDCPISKESYVNRLRIQGTLDTDAAKDLANEAPTIVETITFMYPEESNILAGVVKGFGLSIQDIRCKDWQIEESFRW